MAHEDPFRRLSELSRGYQASRVLLTAAELDLFTLLARGADTPAKVASRLRGDERGVRALLRALAGLGLVDAADGRYRTNALSAAIAGPAGAWRRKSLLHASSGWERWSRLTEAVLKGGLGARRGWRPPPDRENFIAAMESASTARGGIVATALRPLLQGGKRLLDLGCGSGGFSRAFHAVSPGLRITLLDQPGVLHLARRYCRAAGARGAFAFRPGDFLKDGLGTGYDIVFVSSIVHIYSPATNTKLLKRIRASLAPKGIVVLHDYFLDDGGTTPAPAALFGAHMLVSTEEGGTYTRAEAAAWLLDAGFSPPRRIGLPGPTSLLAARTRQQQLTLTGEGRAALQRGAR